MTEERLAIRAPQAGDGEGLARCWIDAGVSTARRNPDLFQVPDGEGLADWFEQWLSRESSDDICSLVAERDGQVVGSVYAALRPPIDEAERQIEREIGQTHAVVHALVVRETSRRQGVGTRLLTAVEAWARERGAQFVLLDTGESNATAIAFYERRMGYWRRARRYRKDLVRSAGSAVSTASRPSQGGDDMTEASVYLQAMARHHAAAYVAHTRPRAILLVGSAAEGVGDEYSDLDMVVYHDRPPSDEPLAAVRRQIGVEEIAAPGPGVENYTVRGVECQVGHMPVEHWERDMDRVLVELAVDTPIHKALSGLLAGIPLHGEGLVGQWQARARAFPEGLARAMVEHYLRFEPVWAWQEALARRDATLWRQQIVVESAQRLLGVLAGLNHRYYSPVQFKRARRFIDTLPIAPADFADRLELLFANDQPAAIRQLEDLVRHTIELVERHLPDVDTTAVRGVLVQRRLPWRHAAG